MAGTRLGELASSSPSRTTRTFDVGCRPAAFSASMAETSAMIGDLSSDAERA
jgi:hypothetical protein